jgi:hypothetical protein
MHTHKVSLKIIDCYPEKQSEKRSANRLIDSSRSKAGI